MTTASTANRKRFTANLLSGCARYRLRDVAWKTVDGQLGAAAARHMFANAAHARAPYRRGGRFTQPGASARRRPDPRAATRLPRPALAGSASSRRERRKLEVHALARHGALA